MSSTSGKPYKITENAELGRYLVATRDILPGESIIDELPLVTGPVVDTTIDEIGSCLICCAKLVKIESNSSTLHTCFLCGLEFCSETCAKNESHSQQECKVLQKLMIHTTLKFLGNKELHNFILTIRCLIYCVQSSSKVKWSQIENLQSQVTELEKVGTFTTISHLFDLLKWEDFDFVQDRDVISMKRNIQDLAKHCLGAMITNAFSIFTPTLSRQGLYFLSSFMSHSCIMTTDRQIHPQSGRMVTRAARLIRTGEAITTSYLSCMNGTPERWRETTQGWRFTCRCERCRNPRHEMGTYLSTIRCPSCRKVSLCPSVCPSGSDDLKWSCVSDSGGLCDYGIIQSKYCSAKDVAHSDLSLWDEMTSPWNVVQLVGSTKPEDLTNLDELEDWLKKYCDYCEDNDRIIHKDHSTFIQTKLYLWQVYGRNLEYGIGSLDDDRLRRKLDYCQDVLRVVEKLYGGIYELKGVLLFEMWSSLVEIRHRKQTYGNDTSGKSNDQFADVDTCNAKLTEVRKDSSEILQYSFEDSQEAFMFRIMKNYENN